MFKLLFSPAGRIGRKRFLIGLAAYVAIIVAFQLLLKFLGNSMWGFYTFLLFLFVLFQGLYGVYGKRLHDMGRSFWPLTAMLVALFMTMIIVMLAFGGTEYFSGFSQYDRKEDIDPEVIKALQADYQANLEKSVPLLTALLWGIIGTFTAWLALAKSEAETNKYGPPPAP